MLVQKACKYVLHEYADGKAAELVSEKVEIASSQQLLDMIGELVTLWIDTLIVQE